MLCIEKWKMGVLAGTFFIVGGTIGAGFISGAELVRFFGEERFLLPLILSAILFFLLSSLYLLLGKKYGGFRGVLGLFGRGRGFVHALFLVCAFVSAAGMLAGLDALKPQWTPLLSLAGLALSVFFLAKGMRGIGILNLILVPVLLLFVFFCGGGRHAFFYPAGRDIPFGWTLYAAMNALLIAPVLMDAGLKLKKPVLSAFFASFAIALAGVCILSRVYGEGSAAIRAEMPFLYAVGGRFFCVAVALAILTSLVSSLYAPLSACDVLSGKKKIAAKGGVLLAAFLLSRVGLSGIVSVLYPVIGVAGVVFSALCILYDQLFKKHHKKIHSRREHAEDTGGSHHEIELEHLPAVHDEISEPRA